MIDNVCVIFFSNSPGSFLKKHFTSLVDDVDAFSLMTYDFSSFQNPGRAIVIYVFVNIQIQISL